MVTPPAGPSDDETSASNESGDAIWRHYTTGVKRLPGKRTRRVSVATDTTKPAPAKAKKIAKPKTVSIDEMAQAFTPSLKPLPKATAKGALTAPDRQTLRKLKRGTLDIEAEIDLHGYTQEQAHDALHRFILQADAKGLRRVRIITGKGGRTGKAPGILRRNVPLWLNEPALRGLVAHIHHPPEHEGGTGALVVTLRKPTRP